MIDPDNKCQRSNWCFFSCWICETRKKNQKKKTRCRGACSPDLAGWVWSLTCNKYWLFCGITECWWAERNVSALMLWQSFGPEWRSWADILSVGLTNCLKQFGQGDEDTESLFFFSCQLQLATVRGCTCSKHHPPDRPHICSSAQILMRTNSVWTNGLGTSQAWSPKQIKILILTLLTFSLCS